MSPRVPPLQFFGRRDVFNRTLGTPAYLGEGGRRMAEGAARVLTSLRRWRTSVSQQRGTGCPLLPSVAVRQPYARLSDSPLFLAAPEVCAGESYRGRQADVWALGVSLYLFIFGQLPFQVRAGMCAGEGMQAESWRLVGGRSLCGGLRGRAP